MLEAVVLTIALSQKPIRGNTREEQQKIYFSSMSNQTIDTDSYYKTDSLVGSAADIKASAVREFSTAPELEEYSLSVSDRFLRYSEDWLNQTGAISSIDSLVANPSYQKIIKLGWDAVPLMLNDLRENKGFWFPALHAITGIRPFDPADAGNGQRMTEAWLSWGKKKELI